MIYDATKEELVEFYINEAREDIAERFDRMFEYYDNGKVPPLHRGGPALSWEEALDQRKEIHGDEVEDLILS